MIVFGHYLHRLDPVLLRISDAIQLRWYGIAYVLGFMAGYYLLVRWARQGLGELKPEKVGDFITGAALFGVVLGGRLGYMLLYPTGRADLAENPLSLFMLHKGGMASHGGIMGLFFFTLWWAKKYRCSWTGLGDNLVAAAPLGIFAGRMANFINGELYGRPTEASWAMLFPEEALSWSGAVEAEKYVAYTQLLTDRQMDLAESPMALCRLDPAFAEGLRPLLTPRHPSQLYAAVLEGLLLFAILFAVRVRWKAAPRGLLTGLFFIGYAIMRMVSEQFRQPDRYILGLTEGQFYSTFMILLGICFLGFASRQKGITVHSAAH